MSLGAGSQISGLTVDDGSYTLYHLETLPGRFAVRSYDIRNPATSCFVAGNACSGTTFTSRGIAGGLSLDEARQLFYLAVTEPTATTNEHWIITTRVSNPCAPVCRYQIQGSCLDKNSYVTGLAYDACSSTLYATDGSNNLEIKVGDPLQCGFTVGLCGKSSGPYGGLAVQSGWTTRSLGQSCLQPPCASCPGMQLTTSGGDPSLGNTSFALTLRGAPGGSGQFAALWLGLGCSSGFPYFCSKFYADTRLGPIVVPIVGTGCNGLATWPAPIAAERSYCGLGVCAQSITVCPAAAGAGVGLSNAIEFTLTN